MRYMEKWDLSNWVQLADRVKEAEFLSREYLESLPQPSQEELDRISDPGVEEQARRVVEEIQSDFIGGVPETGENVTQTRNGEHDLGEAPPIIPNQVTGSGHGPEI